MRARLYYLSVEFQTVPISEVSGEESPERILPRDKCKKPAIHNSCLLSSCSWESKRMFSAVEIHTCSKTCWFCPSGPSVNGELTCAPGAPRCSACTRSSPTFEGAASHPEGTFLLGPHRNFSEKTVIYNGAISFQGPEIPSAPFLLFL